MTRLPREAQVPATHAPDPGDWPGPDDTDDDLRKPCTYCFGTGIEPDEYGYLVDCDLCGGAGRVW